MSFLPTSSKYTYMRIEDKDEKGEGYLVIESKEDLEAVSYTHLTLPTILRV